MFEEPDKLESTTIDIQKYIQERLIKIYRAIDEGCWKQLNDNHLIDLYKGCRREISLRGLRVDYNE